MPKHRRPKRLLKAPFSEEWESGGITEGEGYSSVLSTGPTQELGVRLGVILYCQCVNQISLHSGHSRSQPYALIFGFKTSESFVKRGQRFIMVRPLTEREVREYTPRIRRRVKGPLNFWD